MVTGSFFPQSYGDLTHPKNILPLLLRDLAGIQLGGVQVLTRKPQAIHRSDELSIRGLDYYNPMIIYDIY